MSALGQERQAITARFDVLQLNMWMIKCDQTGAQRNTLLFFKQAAACFAVHEYLYMSHKYVHRQTSRVNRTATKYRTSRSWCKIFSVISTCLVNLLRNSSPSLSR